MCHHPSSEDLSDLCISGLSRAEALVKIDAETVRLKTQIRRLQSLRNTLPPISDLPNEILSKIFSQCHKSEGEPNGNFGISSDEPSDDQRDIRLTLSWVSTHWRSVALSLPKLWSFVTGNNLEYVEECIARSKNFDLSIRLRNPRRQLLQTCLLQIRRLKDFSGDFSQVPEEECIPLLDPLWAQSAPRLTSLSFAEFELCNWPSPKPSKFPPPFGGNHPFLQHLSFYFVLFDWYSLLTSATTISTLHIHSPGCKISIAGLAEKLGTMPALTDCKFVNCLLAAPNSKGKRITLPNLQHLILQENELHRSFTLLDHLEIPNSSVHIRSDNNRTVPMTYQELFRYLESHQRDNPYWGKNEIRHLMLDCAEPTEFIFSFSTSPMPHSSEAFNPPYCQHGPRHFTFVIRSDRQSVKCDPGVILFHRVPFSPASLKSAYLTGISREVVFCLAKATTGLRSLKLSSLMGPSPSGPGSCIAKSKLQQTRFQGISVSAQSRDELFPALEDLEVDGLRYASFSEFHRARTEIV